MKESSWNVEETRDHITRLYGREQTDLARPSLRSLDDRQIYARIHYQDALTELRKYVDANLQDKSLLMVTAGGDGQAWADFNVVIRTIGAYIIACVQSIHTLPDILAHAIYFSLALNKSARQIRLRSIGCGSLVRRLESEPDVHQLRLLLSEIANGGAFEHLDALANHSKHRSLIFPSLSEDWTGLRADRHAIAVGAFEYEGVRYPQVEAKGFLTAEYERCSKLVVDIGNELNSVLANRA